MKLTLAKNLFDSLPDKGLVSENLMNNVCAETGDSILTKYKAAIKSLDPNGFPEGWSDDYNAALKTAKVKTSERVGQLWLTWASNEGQNDIKALDKFFADLGTKIAVGNDAEWESAANVKQKEAEGSWKKKTSQKYKWNNVAQVNTDFFNNLKDYIGVKEAAFQNNEAQLKSHLDEESGEIILIMHKASQANHCADRQIQAYRNKLRSALDPKKQPPALNSIEDDRLYRDSLSSYMKQHNIGHSLKTQTLTDFDSKVRQANSDFKSQYDTGMTEGC